MPYKKLASECCRLRGFFVLWSSTISVSVSFQQLLKHIVDNTYGDLAVQTFLYFCPFCFKSMAPLKSIAGRSIEMLCFMVRGANDGEEVELLVRASLT